MLKGAIPIRYADRKVYDGTAHKAAMSISTFAGIQAAYPVAPAQHDDCEPLLQGRI